MGKWQFHPRLQVDAVLRDRMKSLLMSGVGWAKPFC